MPLAKLPSVAVRGIEALSVQVEVDVASGLPGFTVVGLADKAVEESRERVRSALRHCGFDFPIKRITVNLAPSEMKKTGAHFDLPIALGILLGDDQIKKTDQFKDTLMIGGLSLDGSLQAVSGTLVMAEWAAKNGLKRLVLPMANYAEATLVDGIELVPVSTLNQVIDWLKGELQPLLIDRVSQVDSELLDQDWLQIQGQMRAKRAAIVAASGGHNLLLDGPPGSGKTLLAKGIRSIMPPLDREELIEVVKLHSVAGELSAHHPVDNIARPFRQPHHSASAIAVIGGGASPRPGEISLSHRGVLFLDELPEFHRDVIEALRQPLEEGEIHVSRIQSTVRFPADFLLIATMNPCPCGWHGSKEKECTCSPNQVEQYRHKISGPIMDRIDLYLQVPLVKLTELKNPTYDRSSLDKVKKLIAQTRLKQLERNNGYLNAKIPSSDILRICRLTKDADSLLDQAAKKMVITGRGFHKLLKISRTLADLNGSQIIEANHLSEALQYRFPDFARQ